MKSWYEFTTISSSLKIISPTFIPDSSAADFFSTSTTTAPLSYGKFKYFFTLVFIGFIFNPVVYGRFI